MSPLPLVFQISHLRPPHSQPLLRQCVHIYLGEMILGGEWWGWDLSSFSCNYSQLMCPPLPFTLKFQPAPPSPTPNQYSIETDSTDIFYANERWGGGWGGGGTLPSFLSWRNGGLPGTYLLQQFSLYRIIFHPSENDCISLCGVWGVYSVLFLSCRTALSQFRWYALRWWYYLHFTIFIS